MSARASVASQSIPSIVNSPSRDKSRRGSAASASIAARQEEKFQLSQALDKIHHSATQRDVLTTFNDLEPPIDSTNSSENKGIAGDLVQSGFGGLSRYFRFKADPSGPPPAKERDKNAPRHVNTAADTELQSPTSSRASIISPRDSIPSVQRAETGNSNVTYQSAGSDSLLSPIATTAAPSTSNSQPQPAGKPSSTSNLSYQSSKSASSSRQNLQSLGSKPIAAIAPVTVSAFKESGRNVPSQPEEATHRPSGKRLSNKPGEPQLSVITSESSGHDIPESKSFSSLEKPKRADSHSLHSLHSLDGTDSPISPIKTSAQSITSPVKPAEESGLSLAPARMSARGAARRPAVIDRISRSESRPSHSRSSSLSQGTAEASQISTAAHESIRHDGFGRDSRPERMKSGAYRIPGTTVDEGDPELVSAKLESMRKQVLSKDFWMADETCNECFLCAAPFTAFRRKHHCRTCGCIFDSRCTTIISGQRFGVQGTLRVCKSCLAIMSQRQDGNMSDDSADDSYLPAIFRPQQTKSSSVKTAKSLKGGAGVSERSEDGSPHSRSHITPMMAIPTRRIGGETSNRSAVLEIDSPQLSRPSSSRSLRSSASGRPQSSGHRRHQSKHNLWSRLKVTPDHMAPFRKAANEEVAKKVGLPAFHDDNVIDPDLAPYMSDESSGDEQMSIMGAMNENESPHPTNYDHDRQNFGSYIGGGKRNRNRTQADKSMSGFSFTSRGFDEGSGVGMHPRASRRRNLSTASTHMMRSPRPKSAIFKGPSDSNETLPIFDSPGGSVPRLTRSSSMKGEKQPRVELNPASLLHVRKLLRQLLDDAGIPNGPAWEKALVPILLKCTNSVDPDIDRGDDIDIRHYVKLKKIPGGRPTDTSYVSGVIFSKKLALKSMPRRMSNPRVVIVSFPIEYQRHEQHFMSLQPVIEQEKQFLSIVVQKIILLRPQLLLAEKGISGLALQLLSDANIAVAYNVKPSVLSAVSRCLETEIISSVDMLALPDFQTGKSAAFEVKTFVNEEIPGRKKTYIFLSTNQENLGCTIALRGAPTDVLSRLKRITEFMVYVVYNLKLESCLMRDSFVQLPTSESLPSTQSTDDSNWDGSRQRTMSTAAVDDVPPSQDSIAMADAPTNSPADTIARDQLLTKSLQHTNRLISLHESHARASHDSLVPEDIPMPTYYSDVVSKYETRILSASPFVKFSQPYLLVKAREQERRLVHLKRLRDQDIVEERVDDEKPKPQKFQLIKPKMVHETGHKAPRQIMEILHAVHDAEYDKALYNYQTQTRQWENYIQGNLDMFEPFAHQNIVVLHSAICTETKIPCIEPTLIAIAFYDEHSEPGDGMDPDCTLGQYIENICFGAESTCTANGCDRKMYEHHQAYVHGEARITVFIEREMEGTLPRENIMMWSYCKICKRETSEMEMSKGTWKYSFGKYLELSFWSRGTRLVKSEDGEGWDCPHDHHRDHIRYFGLSDKVVRLHYDPIDLLEIIVPRARITWKVEHDLTMKNDIFTYSQERWTRFTNSVKVRLKAIKLDNILPEKAEACKTELDRLTKKIQDDHASLVRRLQDAYMTSKYYEVIPFNVLQREMLERVQEWDATFVKFEADFLPSDKDIRRLTMLQLRKMFGDESKESLASGDTTLVDPGESTEKTTQTSASESDIKTDTQPTEISPDTSQLVNETEKLPSDIPPPETALSTGPDAALGRVQPLDLATPAAPVPAASAPVTPGATPPVPTTPGPYTPNLNVLTEGQSETSLQTPVAVETAPPTTGPPHGIPASPQTPTARPEKPPSLSVTEQVEQLRRRQNHALLEEARAANPEEPGTQTVIAEPIRPGLERGTTRRAGLTVSPPMMRAISQPAGGIPTLARNQAAAGKNLLGLGKNKDKLAATDSGPSTDLRKIPTNDSTKGEKKMFGLRGGRKGNQSSIPRFVGKKDSTRVTTIRKHFEQLSREFEKEREKDRKKRAAKISHSRPFLQKSRTKAVVEVYEDIDEAVQEPGPIEDTMGAGKEAGEPSETSHDVVGSQPRPPTPTGETDAQRPQSPKGSPQNSEGATAETEIDNQTINTSTVVSDDEQGESDTDQQSIIDGSTLEEIAESLDSNTEIPLELPKHDKMNFMKVLTNFWNERSASEWPSLDYPLNETDHIFIDSDIIVREDEPSSLIAFALSSGDYVSKMRQFHQQKEQELHQPPSVSGDEALSDAPLDDGENISQEGLEASLVDSESSHFKYQFSEGSARMLVKIFYAEQFDALRRKCGVADRIVESLSRCLKWDSKGGKTKSVFLKTLDDRLVMKSLSQVETSAFLRFAPAYFSIMAEALFHDLPSVIAKMLGFFQVIIKNPATNTEIKLDLLLMENLFYDRAPTRIFDLKGSMRNRKIQSTGEQNEVLLDENMVEYIYESPLFAREHSKKLLRASVWNDTLFLARQNVMDYSLMIAVDEVRRELVVGIIDCIRTYTWDKKLESWIKDRGFAGGGRNRPTVTSPKEYKSRFREAMARYILQAPNCWHQFNVPLLSTRPRHEMNAAADDNPVVVGGGN